MKHKGDIASNPLNTKKGYCQSIQQKEDTNPIKQKDIASNLLNQRGCCHKCLKHKVRLSMYETQRDVDRKL